MTTAALLLHPVRLRIVQALLGGRDLTTTQLGGLLPDVPPATLYRQVATLLDGGVLQVVHERQLRGIVERTYRLVQEAASVGVDEVRAMSCDEHRRGFLTFVAGLLAGFDRYLDACADAEGHVDVVADRVGYRQAVMHLTDAEIDDMLADLAEVFSRYRDTPAGAGRSRRLISTVLLKE